MEDPDEDWEIGEYTSSSDYYLEEEGKSNIKWILKKGLGIGKKVVITGFVISSAPLVLPSVVVVSALGLAVSVPFGVMFASYSSTLWLMNKLLPIPTEYPKLEHGNAVDYDNMVEYEEEKDGEIKYFIMQKEEIDGEIEYFILEKEGKERVEDVTEGLEEMIDLVTGENERPRENDHDLEDVRQDDECSMEEEVETKYDYMEEEEKEQMEDMREGIEKRIELVENENELPRGDDDDDLKEIKQEDEERLGNGEESLKVKEVEIGYVNMEEEEKEQMEDIREEIEERIELVKNESELPLEDDDDDLKEIKQEDKERLANGEESLKEEGYEEDIDDDLEVKDERPEEAIDVRIEGERVEREHEAVREESKDGEQLLDLKIKGERVEGEHEVVREESKDVEQLLDVKIEGERVEGEHEAVREESKDVEQLLDVKIEGERVEGEHEAVREESKDVEQLLEVKRIVVMVGGEKRSESEGLVVIARGVGGEIPRDERAIDNEEGGDLKNETVGLLEKIRDEGNVDDAAKEKRTRRRKKKKNNKGGADKSHVEGKDDHRNVPIMKELENRIEEENEHLKTRVHMIEEDYTNGAERNSEVHAENKFESGSLLEDRNEKLQKVLGVAIVSELPNVEDEYVKEKARKRGRINGDYVGSVAKEVEPSLEMEDILLENKGAVVEGNFVADNGHITLEEELKAEQSSEVIKHQRAGDNVDSGVSYSIPEKEEIVIYSNGVMREATDENDLADQMVSEVQSNYPGNEEAAEYILKRNVDIIEIPMTESRPEPAPKPKSEPEHRDNSSRVESKVLSEKEWIVGDKKIWEQIDALRTIVGYNATLQKSCIDELKALYIFTGVEPPSSFENTTDLAELNLKLRFLMSIVGVK